MDTSRLTTTGDFLGRAALIVFFGVLATGQTLGLAALVKNSDELPFLEIATRLASLAFLVLVVGMTIIRLKPIRRAEGFEPRFSALAGTSLSLILVAIPHADIGTELRVLTLILVTVGWVLSACVLLWLGRAFSVMAQAQRLVTTGPYAVVRHPLYLCEEVAVLGIALTHFSIATVLIVTVQWMFQLRRMTNEETVLRAAFPEYAAYGATTPKVIPRLFALVRPRAA